MRRAKHLCDNTLLPLPYPAPYASGAVDMRTASQPLRSFLFAPGNHARRVANALSLNADAVILDLEDAVATASSRSRMTASALSDSALATRLA